MSAQTTVWTADTQVGTFDASYTITFEYCQDFTGDNLDDVKVTIRLNEPGDIEGVGFDLNGDVDDLFTNGTMSITDITKNVGYNGPLVLDIAEQAADTSFNDQPIAQTTSPFDVTLSGDNGSSTGNLTEISFIISDSAGDVDAKALLDETNWYLRGQSHAAGASSKTAGTAPELNECDDEPEEEHDPGSAMTPGFWKNHAAIFLQETGHALGDSWEAVFGVEVMAAITAGGGRTKVVTLDPTLGNALDANGGGEAALLRASTAAWANASSDDLNYSYANVDGTLAAGVIESFGLYDDPTTTDDDAAFAAALADAFDFVVGIAETIDLNDDLLLSTAEIINAVQDVYDDPDATTDFFSWSDVGDVAKALDAMNNMPHIDAGDFA